MNICMSIGYPVKTSKSPSIHNAGYKELGIDDEFIYVRREIKPDDLKKAMNGVRALDIRGVSVTMPHKQEIMKYLDKVDKEAEKIGAVNTVVNNNGILTGFNTDYIGAITALEKRTKLKGKKTAVIGAGGAARAIVYGLNKNAAMAKIFNRSWNCAQSLAREFGCEAGSLDDLDEVKEMDIIINATSVGMNENRSPLKKSLLNNKHLVFDVVYSPRETRLIKDAKSVGAEIVYGYEMLLYQGAAQFKLYTGYEAPVKAMEEVLIKNLK